MAPCFAHFPLLLFIALFYQFLDTFFILNSQNSAVQICLYLVSSAVVSVACGTFSFFFSRSTVHILPCLNPDI